MDFASLIPSLFQGGMGVFQSILGAMNKPQRPVYQVPDSVRQATNTAENLASGNMPGMSTLQGMIDNQSGQALNTIKAGMGGSPNLGGAVADVLGKTNDAKNNLAVENATFKTNAAQNLINQENVQGQYEDKAQSYNNLQKYQEQSNASSALSGAGIHNMFNGLSSGVGASAYAKLYEQLFGQPYGQDETDTANSIMAGNTAKNNAGVLGNMNSNSPIKIDPMNLMNLLTNLGGNN